MEELSPQSGALALVTNLVMAWNTHQRQTTLDHWRATGERQVDADTLSQLTPIGFKHINFDGVLTFSLGRHRARILPSSPPPDAPDRALGRIQRMLSLLLQGGAASGTFDIDCTGRPMMRVIVHFPYLLRTSQPGSFCVGCIEALSSRQAREELPTASAESLATQVMAPAVLRVCRANNNREPRRPCRLP